MPIITLYIIDLCLYDRFCFFRVISDAVAHEWRTLLRRMGMQLPKLRIGRKALTTIKAEPAEGRRVYYDEELTGFALRVEPSGRITYFIEYRPGAGGRQVLKKRLNLGTIAELTPEEARKRASELLAAIRLGGDPAADKKLERAAPTMKEFAKRFLEEEVETKLKPGTLRNYKSYVSKYITPTLGTSKVDKIQPDEVARLHRKIGKERPTVANRVIECIGSIYRYAALCGLVPKGHNPAAGISAFKETARERFLSLDEINRLGDALALAEADGLPWKPSESRHLPKTKQATVIDRHAAAAIRLLLLTGWRLREVLHLRWSEIDFERGVALLADTKTGRRYAVLTAPALLILKELDRFGDYVIAGSGRDKPRSDLNRPWRAVRAHAGLDDVRIHDLRHTNASVAASGGVPLAIVGKLLGHNQASTTQRYAHLADDPVRAAADTVGSRIAAALTGKPATVTRIGGGTADAA